MKERLRPFSPERALERAVGGRVIGIASELQLCGADLHG